MICDTYTEFNEPTSPQSTVPMGWGGGEAGTNYQGPAFRKAVRGPIMLLIFFVFLSSVTICRLYKLTLSHQAQVILQLTVFKIWCKYF